MSIQKASKNNNNLRLPRKPFEMIYRQVLDKLKNSDSLAVYCHLSGKPDNWEINDQYLMNHFEWGRDKSRNAINTLIVNKLIRRIQLIDEKGHFAGRVTELLDGYEFKEYIEYDKKLHNNLCEYIKITPWTEKPSYGLPVDGKQAATIEDIKAFKREDKKQEREALSLFEPNDENQQLVEDLKLDRADEVESFKNRHKGQKTQYEFSRWVKNSRKYKDSKKIKTDGISKDAVNKQEFHEAPEEFVQKYRENVINGSINYNSRRNSHGSEISNRTEVQGNNTRGNGMRKAESYLSI